MSLAEERVHSKLLFVCALIPVVIILSLYFYNIIRWRNTPELGFAFRTATGLGMISVLRESGREAGLQVGDRVLRVNGKDFSTITEFRSALIRVPGQSNTYLLERGGRQFEATITNQPLGFRTAFVRSGFPYLVGLIYVLIAILVFFMKPYHRASWVFFLWSSIFGLYLSFLIKIDEFRPFWLSTVHMFLYTFTPAVFVHMAMSFPEERMFIKKQPWIQIIPYIPSIIIFASMRAITPEMWNLPKMWRIIAVVYMVLAILIYFASCLQLRLTSKSEIVKARARMILLGAAITASIPLSENLINAIFGIVIVPSLNYYLPFLIGFPLALGFSIVKHNLFDFETIIRRTYGYILTTATIAGVYGVVVLVFNLAFRRFEITKSPLFPLIFILGVAFLFNPIRDRAQKFIDRVFYRLEYDYQETVQKISESLKSLLSFGQIGQRMMETASNTMFMESGCVFILKPEEKVYEPLTCIERRDELGKPIPSALSASKLPANDPLVEKISQRKKELTIYDIQEDPLFEQERETCQKSFDHLDAALIVPLVYEDSLTGLMSLGKKKSGKFYRQEDINLLRILANQGAVAIENARLHQARIEALENSKKELEQLNRAKSRALDHLSHELRTPLSVIQGSIRILKRKTQSQTPPMVKEEIFDSLEKNLSRLSDIQQETDKIIRSYQELEKIPHPEAVDLSQPSGVERISLRPFIQQALEETKKEFGHRDMQITVEGERNLTLDVIPEVLREIFIGLLRNAIENTPDEGAIRVILEQKGPWIQLKVMDFGIGITKENQRHLFDGLFHTLDTELYSSKKPYDFGAGGKGLNLLRIKTYSQQFGFDVSVASQRCHYLPTDRDLCPGKISECPHCNGREDCFKSGGSTFCLTFSLT